MQQSKYKFADEIFEDYPSDLMSEHCDEISQTAKKLKQASTRGIKPKMGRFLQSFDSEEHHQVLPGGHTINTAEKTDDELYYR